MMSKFFIEHPVLANVLAIVLVVLGAVSLYRLPVSEYPNVVPPTVQVTTSYPGASADTVKNTIALPIENQVNGVDKMLYMMSTSAPDGTYILTVTFEIGTDPNIDQVLVQNRVQLALAVVDADPERLVVHQLHLSRRQLLERAHDELSQCRGPAIRRGAASPSSG